MKFEAGVEVHSCKPSTLEEKAGRSRVQGYCWAWWQMLIISVIRKKETRGLTV
jgi:hypothetical protein